MLPDDLYSLALPTPFPVGPVNVYIAWDGPRLTLVDCGPHTAEAHAALEAGLASLGHKLSDISRIIVTHAHADHYGLAGRLAAESGAEVLTHPFNRLTLEDCEEERRRRLAFYADVLQAAGVPEGELQVIQRVRRDTSSYTVTASVGGELNDGDRLNMAGCTWQVLHTPGHSAGLICLYEPQQGVLLSNDHLLRDISSNAVLEPPPPGCSQRLKSLVTYIAQLRRVATLPITLAWPGHGQPIHDVGVLVTQRLDLHARRAGRILELIQSRPDPSLQPAGWPAGGWSAYGLANALFPRCDPFNTFLAISEIVGHLEWLEVEGRVRCVQTNQRPGRSSSGFSDRMTCQVWVAL